MSLPIVVFGAAGSVGRRVVELTPPDRDVFGVDRTLDPPCDVADPGDMERLLTRLPPRFVAINVVGLVATPQEPAVLAATIRSNVQAPALCAAACAGRVEHLTHLSSVAVYGAPQMHPITEIHPLRPATLYGACKRAAEDLVRITCGQHGIPLTVVRATQLFALTSADATLPHTLARGLRAGDEPVLTVDPASRRDYLHVDDAARLLVDTATAPRPGTYNAGSTRGVPLGDLFARAYAAAGRPGPTFPGGPDASLWLDSTAARAAFGWEPESDVADWVCSEIGTRPD